MTVLTAEIERNRREKQSVNCWNLKVFYFKLNIKNVCKSTYIKNLNMSWYRLIGFSSKKRDKIFVALGLARPWFIMNCVVYVTKYLYSNFKLRFFFVTNINKH